MLKFNEEFLQFIWQHRLLKPKNLVSISGKEIRVLKAGKLNLDAGPDFFDALVRVEDITLAGNIEVHVNSSDWLKHDHQSDPSYNNLILHVVYEHDRDLAQNLANRVEVLEIKELIDEELIVKYSQIKSSKELLPCHKQLPTSDDIHFVTWVERMVIERLEEKVKRIQLIFEETEGDYLQTFYTLLCRNFGFKVNSIPFEILSRHLPVRILLKHSDDRMQVEALLLGVAGLLDQQFTDKYILHLQNEFEFLKKKYQLIPLQGNVFKFSKLRPANFPSLRLVQLAALIHGHRNLFFNSFEFTDIREIKSGLQVDLEGYWKNHYLADGAHVENELRLGSESAENIMINTFAPFYFFYGKKLNKSKFCDLALKILESCKSENNKITRLFHSKRNLIKNAADSQGIINLHTHYCSIKHCLRCGIGVSYLKKA